MKKLKLVTATSIFITAFFTSTTFADQDNFSKDNHNHQSYEQLAANFTQWIYSIPYDRNPLVEGNLDCTQPQNDSPVWFVVTGTNTSKKPYKKSVVKCDIPEGKTIFLPLGAYFDTWPCPDPNFVPAPEQSLEEFLTLDAQAIVDSRKDWPHGLKVDGRTLLTKAQAFKQRTSSGLFNLTGDLSLTEKFDSCITGESQNAVADGYWAMIGGLSRGSHIFTFTDGSSMNVNIVGQHKH